MKTRQGLRLRSPRCDSMIGVIALCAVREIKNSKNKLMSLELFWPSAPSGGLDNDKLTALTLDLNRSPQKSR